MNTQYNRHLENTIQEMLDELLDPDVVTAQYNAGLDIDLMNEACDHLEQALVCLRLAARGCKK